MELVEKPFKPEVSYVLVSCCTCKRPKMLYEALKSVEEMILPQDIKVEILVCDNDPEESAKQTVEEFSQNSKYTVHYVVEKERGIAPARNRVLKEAVTLNVSHILCFDDDEILEKNCLVEHINMYKTNEKAYISSGPAYNTFKENCPKYIQNSIIFKQSTTKKTGLERNTCATNNVFFPLNLVKDFDIYFSTEYKFMGGEDGDFFGRATKKGFTIIWNKEAVVYEMVTEARGNLKYIFEKSYYNGYSSALLKSKDEKFIKKRKLNIFSYTLITIFYALMVIPSILLGLSIFFNCISQFLKAKGKLVATLKNKPIDFYKNIYGE